MATVIVYLDKRVKEGDAPCPVKLAVNSKGKTALISLGFAVSPSQWDNVRRLVIGHPSRQTYNAIITARLAAAQHALLSLMERGELKSAKITEIRDKIRAAVLPEAETEKAGTLLARYEKQMSEKVGSTHGTYASTLRSFRAYDAKIDKMRFEDVTRDWLTGYITWAKGNGNNPNTIKARLHILAAVFNAAIDADETTSYPFRRLRLKSVPTKKRSITADAVRMLLEYKPATEAQRKAVNVFRLSFCLCGINMADLLKLAPPMDGRAEYVRAKTSRPYSIRMEAETDTALAQFRKDFPYKDYGKGYRRAKQSFIEFVNRHLQEVAAALSLPPLTSYWARHSWATIAASLDIPKETIAAALGHGGYSVTDVYIDFDMRKVDEANRRVLDWVLYGKK